MKKEDKKKLKGSETEEDVQKDATEDIAAKQKAILLDKTYSVDIKDNKEDIRKQHKRVYVHCDLIYGYFRSEIGSLSLNCLLLLQNRLEPQGGATPSGEDHSIFPKIVSPLVFVFLINCVGMGLEEFLTIKSLLLKLMNQLNILLLTKLFRKRS